MTEQNPAQPTPPAPPAQPEASAAEEGKRPPWGDAANFNAEEAWKTIQNLRKEKGGDPNLRTELDQLRQQQQAQRDALAAALGVKPEETSDADKLAQQIETLRGQIVASERRAISATTGVPEHLLTATTADDLREQAAAFVEFAQAAHYAAATSSPAPQAPAFQPNPAQGQGNTPPSPDAMADAEYEKYFPSARRR